MDSRQPWAGWGLWQGMDRWPAYRICGRREGADGCSATLLRKKKRPGVGRQLAREREKRPRHVSPSGLALFLSTQ